MSQNLIAALQNPDLYPHEVEGFQVIETHISWVILTGPFAKKFLNLVKGICLQIEETGQFRLS